MITTSFPTRLLTDDRGATLTEFAFVAPILIMMLVGIFDLAHTQYTSALVTGAIQKSGRDIGLESGFLNEADIDQRVVDAVSTVAPNSATVTLTKLSHFDFSDIGEEEPYSDTNSDNICNNNEPYEDSNDNGQWDANRGQAGIGGARDALLYTATVSYPRLFPIDAFVPSMPENITIEASTVLRNQPYSTQNSRSTRVGNCP